MYVKSIVEVETNIADDLEIIIENIDTFIDYVNEYVDDKLEGAIETFSLKSNHFGECQITFSFRDLLLQNGYAEVIVEIENDDENVETENRDKYYELSKDMTFVNVITEELKEYVKKLEEDIKEITIPKDETAIFNETRETFFIEVKPISNKHTPDFTNIKLYEDDITPEIIEDGIVSVGI